MTTRLTTASAALPSGAGMPLLGFGTWQMRGAEASRGVTWALDAGYRHLDTAKVYGNESEVGRALAESPVAREDVFVTTKCPPGDSGHELDTLRRSLDQLRTDRVDLWLVHWPAADRPDSQLWSGFVHARDEGLARDIGVSNYSLEQIDEITASTGVAPAVNQVEWSPLLFDRTVLDGHRQRGVVLEGYSGLRGGTLTHPDVVAVAERYAVTPAQVIVRWHLQHGIVVIPKSAQQERIRSNADVDGLVLDDADMARLDALGG
jgi:diketogulonate reductase-like aldo/keto reductase